MKKHLLVLTVLMAASAPALADDATCIKQAESDYGVPSGLIAAMKTAEKADAQARFHLYGPMGLHDSVIPVAAAGLHTDPNTVRSDRCTNIRAAAWLLMNTFGGSREKDILTAVNRYYYGPAKTETGPQTKLVQRRWQPETGHQ